MPGDVVPKGRVGRGSGYILSHKGTLLDAMGDFELRCCGLLADTSQVVLCHESMLLYHLNN